jgi:hypothetical protein
MSDGEQVQLFHATARGKPTFLQAVRAHLSDRLPRSCEKTNLPMFPAVL